MNIDRMRELAGLSEDDTREVTVPGYGVLQRDQLINSAMRNVDDLVDMAKRETGQASCMPSKMVCWKQKFRPLLTPKKKMNNSDRQGSVV